MFVYFAHTLTFVCPDCKSLISVTRVSEHANREDVDELVFRGQCSTCGKSVEAPGYFATTPPSKNGA